MWPSRIPRPLFLRVSHARDKLGNSEWALVLYSTSSCRHPRSSSSTFVHSFVLATVKHFTEPEALPKPVITDEHSKVSSTSLRVVGEYSINPQYDERPVRYKSLVAS